MVLGSNSADLQAQSRHCVLTASPLRGGGGYKGSPVVYLETPLDKEIKLIRI